MTAASRRSWIAPPAVALAVAGLIIVAGGAGNVAVFVLALIGAVTFGDLTRRAYGEPSKDSGDVTDLLTSIAFLLVLLGGAYDAGRGSSGLPSSGRSVSLRLSGLAVILLGVALRASAVRALGSSFSVRLGTRPEQTLVRSGPYRVVRHPNYTGLFAVALGTALGLESALAVAAAFFVWLPSVLLRIAREERLMTERFGDSYRAYAARTWKLVPGLY